MGRGWLWYLTPQQEGDMNWMTGSPWKAMPIRECNIRTELFLRALCNPLAFFCLVFLAEKLRVTMECPLFLWLRVPSLQVLSRYIQHKCQSKELKTSKGSICAYLGVESHYSGVPWQEGLYIIVYQAISWWDRPPFFFCSLEISILNMENYLSSCFIVWILFLKGLWQLWPWMKKEIAES